MASSGSPMIVRNGWKADMGADQAGPIFTLTNCDTVMLGKRAELGFPEGPPASVGAHALSFKNNHRQRH